MSDDIKTRVQKTLEAIGFTWGVSRDIGSAAQRLADEHPEAEIEVSSATTTGNKTSKSEVVIRIVMNKRGTDE